MRRLSPARGLSPEAVKGAAILAAAAAGALIIAVLLLVWIVGLRSDVQDRQAELDLLSARAARAERNGALRLKASDNVERMFLQGATPGLALARFQALVGDAASRSGLSVTRLQPLSSGDDDPKAPYRLGVDAQGSLEQLRSFLADVESTLPVMFVSGLELRPEAAVEAQDPYTSEKLRMSFRIEAYGRRSAQ